MQSFHDKASNALWADFDEENEYPAKRPLLAHYTSIQTFEKIVLNEEFWFSNPLFMNDLEELQFGINEGVGIFFRNEALAKACGTAGRHKILVSHLQALLNDYDSNHVLNTYLMCFSEHSSVDTDGLLSMWRGYGNSGSGAAIVIDTSKLVAVDDSPMIIGKVHYGSKADRIAWINRKTELLAELVAKYAPADDELFFAAWEWFRRLKMFALFTKHAGFAEEREWRAVYMNDRDTTQKFKPFFSHLVTNRGMEPKLKLPLKPYEGVTTADVNLDNLVERIILGPSIASALSVNALRHMLRNTGHEGLAPRVVPSDIPFRQPV